MADDRVLEVFIHNIRKPPIPQIRGYLQEVGFLHTSHMLRGCKLDPTLISALVKVGGSKHTLSTFHTASVQSHSRT
ncbi:hypothetical protein PVK06_039666 [Gossypium arboreum]|uniref:Uncharacterized protein n=1 Tax=Gossypium arboreum TaxID=29729 RepID=A0ABR0N3H2_GOSAR|nr:hypothetical protein PVK06_039666 [Gossypium arboreum]